jgi:hypothetical protein
MEPSTKRLWPVVAAADEYPRGESGGRWLVVGGAV